jgi:hypothetical protein
MTQPADAGQSAWQEACLVAALLAVAPIACGGVVPSRRRQARFATVGFPCSRRCAQRR